jgi:hypothetical protein
LAPAEVEVEEAMALVGRRRRILITRLALERRIMFHQRHKFLDQGFGRGLPVVGLLGMVLGGALRPERRNASNNNLRHSLQLGPGHKPSRADGLGISVLLMVGIRREMGIVVEVAT